MGITRRTKALWDRLSYFLERQYWKVRKFIMSNIVFDLTDGSTKTVDFADLDAIHVKTVNGKIYISIVVKGGSIPVSSSPNNIHLAKMYHADIIALLDSMKPELAPQNTQIPQILWTMNKSSYTCMTLNHMTWRRRPTSCECHNGIQSRYGVYQPLRSVPFCW